MALIEILSKFRIVKTPETKVNHGDVPTGNCIMLLTHIHNHAFTHKYKNRHTHVK